MPAGRINNKDWIQRAATHQLNGNGSTVTACASLDNVVVAPVCYFQIRVKTRTEEKLYISKRLDPYN